MIKPIITLLRDIWIEQRIPLSRGEPVIVPILKKEICNDCSNHHEISLVPTVFEVLASTMLHRLTSIRKSYIQERQAGFRPG